MIESPKKYERHIFVCVNEKVLGKECCGRKGAESVFLALRKHVNEKGLFNRFNVSRSRCIGHCLKGPAVAVYPEGRIFTRVALDDVRELIEKFLT